jgi:hypothetical protein
MPVAQEGTRPAASPVRKTRNITFLTPPYSDNGKPGEIQGRKATGPPPTRRRKRQPGYRREGEYGQAQLCARPMLPAEHGLFTVFLRLDAAFSGGNPPRGFPSQQQNPRHNILTHPYSDNGKPGEIQGRKATGPPPPTRSKGGKGSRATEETGSMD